MLKERIQEIFEFTKSESPYRKANKGWINQDIFLDLSPSSNILKNQNEAAKVTLLWPPINRLLSNIFLIIVVCSIMVFTSLSFVKGRLNFNFLSNSLVNDIVQTNDNRALNTIQVNDSDSSNSEIDDNLGTNDLDKLNKINSVEDNKTNLDQKTITNKIDPQVNRIKDNESSKDIEILKNKKSKSNFI